MTFTTVGRDLRLHRTALGPTCWPPWRRCGASTRPRRDRRRHRPQRRPPRPGARPRSPASGRRPTTGREGLSGARNTGIAPPQGDDRRLPRRRRRGRAGLDRAPAAPLRRPRRARRRWRGDPGWETAPPALVARRSSTGSSAAPTAGSRTDAGAGPQPDRLQHVGPARRARRGRRLRRRPRAHRRRRRSAARRPSSASGRPSSSRTADSCSSRRPGPTHRAGGRAPPGRTSAPLPGRGHLEGLGGRPGRSRSGLASERAYVTRMLPSGVLRDLASATRGDRGAGPGRRGRGRRRRPPRRLPAEPGDAAAVTGPAATDRRTGRACADVDRCCPCVVDLSRAAARCRRAARPTAPAVPHGRALCLGHRRGRAGSAKVGLRSGRVGPVAVIRSAGTASRPDRRPVTGRGPVDRRAAGAERP